MKGCTTACVLMAMGLLGGCATHDQARWVEGCRLFPYSGALTDTRLESMHARQSGQACRVELVARSAKVVASQREVIAAWASESCGAIVADLPAEDGGARDGHLTLSITAPEGAGCASGGSAEAPGSAVEVEPASRMRYLPKYPWREVPEGAEGVVKLTVLVHPGGEVLGGVVMESSGYEALDQAALDAAVHWRFKPRPAEEGVALATVPVRFQLQ